MPVQMVTSKIQKKPGAFWREISTNGLLWLILVPGLLVLIIFKIAPLFGLVISFQNYSSFKGIAGSEWVGFDNFVKAFSDQSTWILAKNTILLAFWTLFASFPVPIIFALFLNELRLLRFKSFVQSVSFFPYFISVAVAVSIMIGFLNPSDGIVNIILGKLGFSPTHFMAQPGWFRPLYAILTVWQNFGYNAIVYVAAIAGISPELYEAAQMDGAGRWSRMFRITLPSLMPMIVTMFIINLGSILSVDINKVLLMQNPSTYATSDVLQTYVYRVAFGGGGFPQYSLGTAISLVQSAIAFVLVMLTNWISKKFTESSAF